MEQSNPSNHKNYHINQKRWILEMAIFILCILLAGMSMAQNVTINDTNFKTYLVGNTSINTNEDGEIQVSEATAYTGAIVANNLNISDLTGIEAFTNITSLYVEQNDLTSVDLTQNTDLEILYLSFNDLTSVDLSSNTELTELYLNSNDLTSLDISANTDLVKLNFAWNNLTSVDLSNNTALTWIRAYGNTLTSIDLSNNTLLDYLSVNETGLTSIDLSNNPLLEYFNANSNSLTSLDISNNTLLEFVQLYGNDLTSLDVTNNTNLTQLNVAQNTGLTSLDLTQNDLLTELDASETGLTTIDLSQNTLLEELSISEASLTSIDISNNTNITGLYIYDNPITELDLSQNTALEYIDLWGTQLTSIDVSNLSALEELVAGGNSSLLHLNVANGNNENLYIDATMCPNLECIQVDNVAYSEANWDEIDDASSFSTDCPDPFELVSLSPANGAMNASNAGELTLTFAHDADIGAGNIQVYRASNDALVTQLSNYNATFMTIDGSSVTFDFPVDFPQGKELYVLVSDGYLRSDLFTEDWEGYQEKTDWTFTVEDTRPQILSFTPTTEVASGQVEIEITYDRDIALTTSTIPVLRVYNSSDTQVAFFNKNNNNISIDGATATLTIAYPLDPDEEYYILMTEGLFVDASDTGNGGEDIDDPSLWTFSTRINDGNGPDISSLSPFNGETQVERNGLNVEFSVTYDEPVYLGNTSSKVGLYREDPLGDAYYYNIGSIASISEDNLTVTFDIPNNYNMQEDTEYYILMEATDGSGRPIIYDADGNGITAIDDENTWRFTTYGPIEITDFDPDNGATNVPVDQIFSLLTNNNLNITGGGTIRLRNYETGGIHRTIIMPSDDVETEGNELNISFDGVGGDLDEGKHYYIDIASGVFRDEWNQTFNTGFKETWHFTTADETAPTVTSLFPLDDNDNVSLTSNLIIDFSENIELGTGNITLYNENDEVIETYSATENFARLTVGFNDIIIDPTEDLEEGMGYYVRIDNDAVKDDDGFDNFFLGILDNTTWNFSTPDETAPTFVSSSPADEATEVALDADLSITFDEEIVGNLTGSNQIRLGLASGPLVEAFTDMSLASVTGNTITINPTEDLEYSTEYIVYFQYGAVQDASGNSAAAFDWTFTTEAAPDETQPSVTSFSPAHQSTNVSVDIGQLQIVFDEHIQKVNPGNIILRDFANNIIVQYYPAFEDEDVSISDNVLTMTLPADLPYETSFYVQIVGGTIADLAGNPYGGFLSASNWVFTTEAEPDETAPSITERSPAIASTGVANDTHLTLTFDEDVQLTGSGLFRMYDRSNDQLIGTIWAFDSGATVDGDEVTYDIPMDIPYGTEVYIEIENAIEDLAGNPAPDILGENDWHFTIEGEQVAPVLVSQSPANGEVNVSSTTHLVMTFDEPIQLAGSGIFKMYNKANDEQIGVNWAFNGGATVDGNTVTYDIPMDLPFETEVYFVISNAIEDVWGNDFAPISGNDGWVVTTEIEPDVTNPQVTSFSPADGATEVALDQALQITFDEEIMVATSGSTKQAVIKFGANQNFEVVAITSDHISGNVLTIPHEDFARETTYSLYLADGVIADLSNNWFEGIETSDWSFTTEDKLDQSITFQSLSDKVFGDGSFTLDAEASSGLAVEYEVVEGPVDIEGNIVTINGAGSVTIAANQSGDETYNAAEEATQTFTIAKADQVITIQSIPDKLTTDEPFDVVASVDTELELDYAVSGPASISGTTITLDGMSGNVTVTVTQSGNNNYNEASSSQVFAVTDPAKTDQTITFESIANKTFGDAAFNLTATASSDLDVTFSVVSGPISVTGNTVTITGAGTAVIAANQSGDNDFNPAPEVTQSFDIAKADQVITIESINNKLTTDSPFDVVASVNSPLDLTYEVSGPASITGTTITLNGSVGTVMVTVSQSGNNNYNAATTNTSFTVSDPTKTDQTITFESIADKTFGDDNFNLAATASSGLDVTFSVVSGPVSVTGNTVTINGAGTAVIAANQSGDNDFNPASEVTQSFNIAKADQVITIESIDDKVTTGAPFEVVASTSSGLDLSYEVEGPASISGTTITLSGTTGTVTVTVSQSGNDNYNEASATASFEVLEESEPLGFNDEINVSFYPNPVRNVLNVEIGEEASVRLLGLDGRVLIDKEMSYGKLDLSSFSDGVLILEVKTATSTIRKRIVRKAN